MKTGKWTDDERKYLQENYQALGSVGVAHALDRYPRHVNSMAMHFKLKRGWGDKPRYRRYEVDEQLFKCMNGPIAYLIGYILADGNIHEREVSITSKDIELLEKARNIFASTHPIRKCKGRNTFRIRIGSKAIINDLKAIGITENKSKTLTLPDIPDRFFFDFLRGYIDGDGSIYVTKQGGLQVRITTGSPNILDDLSDTITRLLRIERHSPVPCTKKVRDKTFTSYILVYCGQCATAICEAIYSHCGDLCLLRKRHSFLAYKNRPKKDWRSNGNATKYKSL